MRTGLALAVLIPVLSACGPGTTDGGPREVESGAPTVLPASAPEPCPETFEQVPDPVLSSDLADPVQVDFEPEQLRVCRYDVAHGRPLTGSSLLTEDVDSWWRLARTGGPVPADQMCTLELGPAFLLIFTGPDATAVSLVVHDYGCHNSEPVSVAGLGVELAQLPWTEAPRALFRRLHTLLPGPGR